MAEDEQKHKGRLAAAVLAGSALTFSSFAIGVPAAMADTTDVENVEETATPEPDAADASPTPTTVASGTPDDSDDDETDDEDPEEDEKEDAEGAPSPQDSDFAEDAPEDVSVSPLAEGDVVPGDQSLTADREQIDLEDFIQDSPTDEDSGVNFTATGFEPDSNVTYEVVSPGNVEGTDGTAWTDENGSTQFYIFGYASASDPEVYLGEY